jgi:hypothetical protein
LDLMQYRSIVEELLLKNPENCGMGASLVYMMNTVNQEDSLAIGLPIMAASFLAPPMIAIAAGSGTTGIVFAYDSYADFKNKENQFIGYIYGDKMNSEYSELESAHTEQLFVTRSLPLFMATDSAVLYKTLKMEGSADLFIKNNK